MSVANVIHGSDGDKAGLQVGDVIVAWSRGEESGRIQSPFDLMEVQEEQGPRGSVTLAGIRGGQRVSWTLHQDRWGFEVRPNLTSARFAFREETFDCESPGEATRANDDVGAEPSVADGTVEVPPWFGVWVKMQTAKRLVACQRSPEADQLYQQALVEAFQAGTNIEVQVRQAWAETLLERGDWRAAVKEYHRILITLRKTEPEDLKVAQVLHSLGDATSENEPANALKYYQESLVIWNKLAPESLLYFDDLYNTGRVYLTQRNLAEAEACFRRALDIGTKIAPNDIHIAYVFHNLANVMYFRGELVKAEQLYQQAYEILAKRGPRTHGMAIVTFGLGNIGYYRGHMDLADRFYRETLNIEESLEPGSIDVARAYSALGNVAYYRGDLAEAEHLYHRALDIETTAAPDSLDLASTLTSLGVSAEVRLDLITAGDYFRRALSIEERVAPKSQDIANTLSYIGTLGVDSDDFSVAERYFRSALAVQMTLAPRSIGTARVLYCLGTVMMEVGRFSRAEIYLRRALSIEQSLAPRSLEVAQTLHTLGDLYQRQNNLTTAEHYFTKSLFIKRKLMPDGIEVASCLHHLGDIARLRGNFEVGWKYYEQARQIREKLIPDSVEYAETLVGLAGILVQKNDVTGAVRFYERAITAFESQALRVAVEGKRRSIFRSKHVSYYRDYIDLLLSQNRQEEAFEALERFRARSLLELLAVARVDIHQGVDATLQEQERDLRATITAMSNRRLELLSDERGEHQLTALDQNIEKMLGEYDELEGRLRASSPAYAALTRPQPLRLAQVQQLLDSKSLLLEYTLGQKRSYLWAIDHTSCRTYKLPRKAEIEDTARRLYYHLSSIHRRGKADSRAQTKGLPLDNAALALSRMVLGPLSKELGQKRLVIVSDGALAYVPFGVLPIPGKPSTALVAEHEIVELASASVLSIIRNQAEHRERAAKAVAVLADAVFDQNDERLRRKDDAEQSNPATQRTRHPSALERSGRDTGSLQNGRFPRLPFSRQEAEAIRTVVGADLMMEALDFDASKNNAVSEQLKEYRIIHFATHGLFNSANPDLSGLVFSLVDPSGREQDGFLRLLDIYNLKLNADLVVLSACQTALGKEIDGEGIVGLTRGFMYAGVPRVMSSLWNVDDEATAQLMGRFYEGMMRYGQTPAAALRSAQMWMRSQRRWHAPYYWAGFVLQGDWN